METTLRRIGDTVGALRDAVAAAWSEGAWSPENWPPTLAWWLLALAVLLMLAALRRGRPRPLDVRPPQLLITQGEVVPDPDAGAPTRRRRANDPSGAQAGTLTMTVSNLSRYPVQLLEVALRGESRGAPRVAEVEAVVPAMGAVEVVTRLPLGLQGDGWLDLYCYAAAPRHKTHRHRAELVWEPWAARFKVAPMEQAVAPARRLASDERNARFEVLAAPFEATAVASVATPATPAPVDPAPARFVAVPRASPPLASAPAASRPNATEPPAAAAAAHRAPTPTGTPRAAEAGGRPTPSLGALWARLPRRGLRGEPQPTEAARGERGGRTLADPGREAGGDPRAAGSTAADPVPSGGDPDAPSGPTVRERRRLEFPDEF